MDQIARNWPEIAQQQLTAVNQPTFASEVTALHASKKNLPANPTTIAALQSATTIPKAIVSAGTTKTAKTRLKPAKSMAKSLLVVPARNASQTNVANVQPTAPTAPPKKTAAPPQCLATGTKKEPTQFVRPIVV